MHEISKNSVFTVGRKICILQLMELGNIGIPMPTMIIVVQNIWGCIGEVYYLLEAS